MTDTAIATQEISAEALTTFDVDPKGMFVRLHLRDDAGKPATLVLPTQCLDQLLMSVPQMMQKAIRNRYRDDSLRVVYPLGKVDVEQGEKNAYGVEQFVLTMTTTDGFSVAFAASESQLSTLGDVFLGDVVEESAERNDYAPPIIRYS